MSNEIIPPVQNEQQIILQLIGDVKAAYNKVKSLQEQVDFYRRVLGRISANYKSRDNATPVCMQPGDNIVLTVHGVDSLDRIELIDSNGAVWKAVHEYRVLRD